MYLLIIILPLITSIIIGLLGRNLGLKGVKKIINLNMLILLIISIILIYEYYIDNNILKINLIINKIKIDILNIEIYMYLDNISQLMLLIIISISYLVLIYSYDYMINDPHIIRFLLYIILFILFMIILISNNSLPIIFIGWEGVGLVSFLLITFWYTRFNTQLGGLIAILMNRIGDIFYILGILISLLLIGSLDIISINLNNINLDLLLLSLFLACMSKSAQIYLHLWLPYSMEGPTPISALIHAATMVTAGVYLLLKLTNLLISSYYILYFITFIGLLTTFIGGSLAIISLDIKELIAYSTMSQLGYMITIIGLKGNNMSFYHLIFHAYFKALLFLTAGAIIHTIFDLQDFRKMGGFLNLLPLQNICTIIGITSLIGFPFTTGFYSKENLLNYSFSINTLYSHYAYLILLISAFFTILYSYFFYIKIFLKENKFSLFILQFYIHFFSKHLLIPLFLLSFITILFGFIFSKWIFLHISLYPSSSFLFDSIPFFIKLIPLFFMIFIFILIYFISFTINLPFSLFYQFYSFKFFYQFISGFFFAISYRIFFKLFDYGFFDLIGPIFNKYLFHNINYFFNFYHFHPISILLTTIFIYLF